jgi:phosphoribosylanthranilate isomerase
MSLWVKICANTSLEDALMAAEAGADAVGFVFAPSPRRVTAETVAQITPHLPGSVEKIGVFVDTEFGEILSVVECCGLTGVQLHLEGQDELPARLRDRFGADLRILRVIHYGEGAALQLDLARKNPAVDAVLVDSRTAHAVGGTGVVYDWSAARQTLFNSEMKLIAAGGLTPANVAEAIAMLHPWGVDVASGVEATPGHKDVEKVQHFVSNARQACGA